MQTIIPGPDLLLEVRIGFIRNGTSLRAWADRNSVAASYLIQVLRGRTNGPCAQEWRARLIDEAGITAKAAPAQRLNARKH
jgi:hypothetical protein